MFRDEAFLKTTFVLFAFIIFHLFFVVTHLPKAGAADPATIDPQLEMTDEDFAPDSKDKQKPPVTTVISSNRREIPIEKTTRAVTVITREQIEKSGKVFLLDLLRGQTGITITQLGTYGRESHISIRGVNKESTLVMIDNVQINNMNQQIAALSDMTTANIERIEIIRGTQSVLYGADAAGGMIHIITKPDAKKGLHADGRFEYGTYETFYEEGIISGSTDKFSFTGGGGRLDTEGVAGNDDYQNTTGRFHGKAQVTENSNLDIAFHYFNSQVGIDDGFTTVAGQRFFRNDPNRSSKARQQVINSRYTAALTEWWEQYIQYSFFHDTGMTFDPRDPGVTTGADPELAKFRLDGNRHTVEYQSDFYISDFDVFTAGYEFEHGEVTSKSTSTYNQLARNHGWFLQNELTLWEIWTIVTGIRFDEHELYGMEATPLVSTGLWIDDTQTKLKGSFGKGFRAPTFNQLFFPNFGNPDLLPETSWNWDAGAEQFFWDQRTSLSAMYFDYHIKNLIQNTTPLASNVGRARSQGVELEHRIEILKGLNFNTNYTYTHSIDKDTGKRIIRIPRHSGKFGLSFDKGRFHGSVDWIWAGTKDDNVGTSAAMIKSTIDEFSRLDFALFYDLTQYAQIYSRMENANNDHYFEADQYVLPSTRFLVGLKAKV